MLSFYKTLRPLLFTLDPEKAHALTLRAMKGGVFPGMCAVTDSALSQDLWGLKFPNPVGLSAGFDKNAEVVGPAFKLGFGFVEAGTVTPKPQDGNPKPRILRDPANKAVINRMGFPNGGMQAFKDNLAQFYAGHNARNAQKPAGIVGVNIGMNKTQTEPAKDYIALIHALGPMADYLAVNISSPNTPGLRDLQSRDVLIDMLAALKAARASACGEHQPPLLVKFAPDLDDAKIEELAQTVVEAGIDGIILSNTTLDRPDTLSAGFKDEMGGLSGLPVREKSTAVIRKFYALTGGKMPIIGVGGISSAADAYAKIKAGASLVQLYTGLIYEGPSVAKSINEGLLDLLRADGFDNIAQAIGCESDA